MKSILSTLLVLLFTITVSILNGQDIDAYHIYNAEGERVTFSDVVHHAMETDIILYGELHNNPITHWLRQNLVQQLAADTTRALAVGMEMFEADQQVLMDEYLTGIISERNFEQEARLWNNYQTDYRPMVQYLKNNEIPIVATNIPRRYANTVYHGGLEALENLSEQAKSWIAPLPVTIDLTLPGYANIMEAAGGHGGENLPKSQAIKDATMGYFSAKFIEENPGTRFFHFHGTYHSNDYEGIYWYLRYYGLESDIMTVATVETADLSTFDFSTAPGADFVVVIPSSMIKTH